MDYNGIDVGPDSAEAIQSIEASYKDSGGTQQYSLDANGSDSVLGTNDNKETIANNDSDNTEGTDGSVNSTESNSEHANEVASLNEGIKQSNATLEVLKKDLSNRGIDLNKAIKEYNEYGALSSQTIADLGNAGYPKEIVDSFIQSRQLLEEQFTNAVYKEAGGASEFNRIQQWASNNLTEKQTRAFNKAIDSNDLETLSLIMSGIKSKMVSVMGTRNPSLIGGASTNTPSRGYSGKDEVVKAMSDPRYGRDPNYTREVERKMMFTNL